MLEVELMESTPLIVERVPSMGLVTIFSTSEGAAPGYGVVTIAIGKVIEGIRSIFTFPKETKPKTITARTIIKIVTGRFTENLGNI